MTLTTRRSCNSRAVICPPCSARRASSHRRRVPSCCRRKSCSVTNPINLPSLSITGRPLIWCSINNLAASAKVASGPTVAAPMVITSPAFIVKLPPRSLFVDGAESEELVERSLIKINCETCIWMHSFSGIQGRVDAPLQQEQATSYVLLRREMRTPAIRLEAFSKGRA